MLFQRLSWRLLAGLVAIAAISGGTRADPIPQTTLDNVYNGCVDSCTKAAPTHQATCQKACRCVADQTGALLTNEDLTAAENAIDNHQQLPPDLAAKSSEIKSRCTPSP